MQGSEAIAEATQLFYNIITMALKCDITGRGIMFGNNVSHAKNRTRTTWAPNLHEKRLHSKVLGFVRMKISNRGLRTINKHGGLDEYLSQTLKRKLTPICRKLQKQVVYSHATATAE